MSPVAITPPISVDAPTIAKCDKPRPPPVPTTPVVASEISRRPSPWHEIEHSLSATSVSSRRASTSHVPATPAAATADTAPIDLPGTADPPSPSPALSSSQALRDWEERLLSPASDVQRHQLVHTHNPIPGVQAHVLTAAPSRASPSLPPKLAAERDKEGHIEYKLKLIDPSPERFGKLVTQMMWRLKQGKNEAIYELGLADDGTVVGLTRPEMDASLRTLELMASELGATVMILREIVLSATSPPTAQRDSPGCSDLSSSAISLSSSAYSSHDGGETGRWPVRRPDLDEHGQPRRGTKVLSSPTASVDGLIKKPSTEYVKSQLPRGRQVIFNPKDLEDGETDAETEEDEEKVHLSSCASSSKRNAHERRVDDDIPPFHLDLEDSNRPIEPTPHGRPSWRRRRKPQPEPAQHVDPVQSKRMDAKRLKSAQRREARRLDLLRGDGMNPLWTNRQPAEAAAEIDTGSIPAPAISDDHVSPVVKLPHQPARPSSLRLASPPPDDPAHHSTNQHEDDGGDLWSLSHMPLDSLSLSFANVQIEDISPPSSPSSETEYAVPVSDDVVHIARPPPTGEEMICVEALVVRKVQHGHGADGSDAEQEEECGWGGEDDVWGLGVDDD